MTYKDAFKRTMDSLADMTSREIEELIFRAKEELEKRSKAKYAAGRVKALARRKADKDKDFHVAEWACEYLKPGMLVHVKSASSKTRLVTEVKISNRPNCSSFWGWHINAVRLDAAVIGQYRTDHMMDKITHVMVDADTNEPSRYDPMSGIADRQVEKKLVPISAFLKTVKLSG